MVIVSPPSLLSISHILYIESVSDFVTIFLISNLVLFSLISLVFIFHFHLKSKQSHTLQNFNSLSSVRILLVCFISLWALTEFLRLPFTRTHLFSFFPSLSISQQSDLCKLHLVLSLGLFQPGFLVTLLFLLSFSIKRKDPNDTFGSAVGIVFALCLPVLLLQAYFIFYPRKSIFPQLFYSSYLVLEGTGTGTGTSDTTILCSYPLLSTIVFGAFAVVYILYFLLACCKIVSLVINKGLRIRIYALLISILVALPTQVALLTLSTLWNPVDPVFNVFALAIFLTVLMCAAVGEGILIIRPIADALAVGREFRWWGGNNERLPVVLGDKQSLTGVKDHIHNHEFGDKQSLTGVKDHLSHSPHR